MKVKVFVETGDPRTGKTTRIHAVATRLERRLKEMQKQKCLDAKCPRQGISAKQDGDIKRCYTISGGGKKVVVSFFSKGDSTSEVANSFRYAVEKNNSDIHVMASRDKSWVEDQIQQLNAVVEYWPPVEKKDRASEVERMYQALKAEICTRCPVLSPWL